MRLGKRQKELLAEMAATQYVYRTSHDDRRVLLSLAKHGLAAPRIKRIDGVIGYHWDTVYIITPKGKEVSK